MMTTVRVDGVVVGVDDAVERGALAELVMPVTSVSPCACGRGSGCAGDVLVQLEALYGRTTR